MNQRYSFMLVAIIFLAAPMAHAQTGNLFVSPQRLQMHTEKRTDQLHLVNKSDSVKSYEISMKNYAMNDHGTLGQEVEDMPYSAKDMIRFSPRRVTLEPGTSQYVRVMLRAPKDLEPGGYHAHIEFTEIENANNRKSADGKSTKESQVSFSVGATYGVAIPVFVTIGGAESSMSLGQISTDIKPGSNIGRATVELMRSGNNSAQEKLTIHYIDAAGQAHIAAPPANVSVYREKDKVSRTMQLHLPEGVKFSTGKLKLTLNELELTDNPKTLDEKTVSIP